MSLARSRQADRRSVTRQLAGRPLCGIPELALPRCPAASPLRSRVSRMVRMALINPGPNIVGPLSSTSISVSIAACHSGKSRSCSSPRRAG